MSIPDFFLLDNGDMVSTVKNVDTFHYEPHYMNVYQAFIDHYSHFTMPVDLYKAAMNLEMYYEKNDFEFTADILRAFLIHGWTHGIEPASRFYEAYPMSIRKMSHESN